MHDCQIACLCSSRQCTFESSHSILLSTLAIFVAVSSLWTEGAGVIAELFSRLIEQPPNRNMLTSEIPAISGVFQMGIVEVRLGCSSFDQGTPFHSLG